jgi:lysophospholipase L1-like esterase
MVLFLSLAFSLILTECIMRVLFSPVDYLQPYLIYDNELRALRVKPNSAGHDSWGYRNKAVPNIVDIVAIGDSQTYGISAKSNDSWPSQLQKITQKTVYNLSLGGYNPMQYYILLKNKALSLNPSIIIVGFYYGNDLIEVYNNMYDEIKLLNNQNYEERGKIMSGLRSFLSHHSILYRIITFSIGDTFRFFEMKFYKLYKEDDITIFENKEYKIHTGFTPLARLMALDYDDQKIQKGLQISLELFSEMDEICKKNNIIFIVLLIHTKESIYSKYIENNNSLRHYKEIDKLLENEKTINTLVKDYFKGKEILYIDTLEDLQKIIEKQSIYFGNEDGHPSKYGYEIIAKTIHKYLQELHILAQKVSH